MKIIIEVGHPKQVHFRKNIIRNLQNRGHDVKIVAQDKDLTLYLLRAFGFEYEVIGKNYKGLLKKGYGLLDSDYKLLKIARKFNPDIFVSGSPCSAQVSKILGKPHIAFSDTENANLTTHLMMPFSDVILTPSSFQKKLDPKKHKTYDGYEELAYLHPNYFNPDPSVLDCLNLNKKDKFIVMRLVAWKASHDIGDKGFNNIEKVIESLEKDYSIFITSEIKLNINLEKYRLNIPPEQIHHVLYFAQMYIGESAAMACESAVLGTPAIFVSTSRRGYTDELENKYDLLYNFSDNNRQQLAMNKAMELLRRSNLKDEWNKKRLKMLNEKMDVTKFITDFIENYPERIYRYPKME